MIRWIKEYNEASSQTKFFVLNGLVYGLAIIITSVYCYGRLDFVRSYPSPGPLKTEQKQLEQHNFEPAKAKATQ